MTQLLKGQPCFSITQYRVTNFLNTQNLRIITRLILFTRYCISLDLTIQETKNFLTKIHQSRKIVLFISLVIVVNLITMALCTSCQKIIMYLFQYSLYLLLIQNSKEYSQLLYKKDFLVNAIFDHDSYLLFCHFPHFQLGYKIHYQALQNLFV